MFYSKMYYIIQYVLYNKRQHIMQFILQKVIRKPLKNLTQEASTAYKGVRGL